MHVSHDADVAIVGLGPVGATLANLLGPSGLTVAVLEREASVFHNPRAASLDAEAMRVFQAIGLADAVVRSTGPAPGMRFVNAEGRLLLHWQRHGASPEGWQPAYRFHQPALETILRDGLARFAPRVSVALRTEVEDISAVADGVALKTLCLDTGARRTVRARYVVGCDGARSLVRRAIGGELRDLGERERWMVLDLLLTEAAADAATDAGGDAVQHCDPARPATYIPMVGRRRRWEFMLMPGDDPADIIAPARVWDLLRPWKVGPNEAAIERAVVYTFAATVATRWRSGRLLLAGDAAHQMPPFLGQGLCAGLRDAANLAWKLAAVARNEGSEQLLDSYPSERAPHVEAVIALAVRLGRIIQATDPAQAAARDRAMVTQPEILRVVMPPLGPGLHGDAPAPAGRRAAQPRLADGTPLDDRVGYRLAVLARPSLLGELDDSAAATMRRLDVCVVAADGGAATWLDELRCAAIVLRPDRAILGIAANAGELACVLDRIPLVASLKPPRAVPFHAEVDA